VSGFLFGPGSVFSTHSQGCSWVLSWRFFWDAGWAHLLLRSWCCRRADPIQGYCRAPGALVALIIFALPYFPKDYFCLILGMSGMSLKVFSAVILAGRLPSTFLFTLQGARLYEGDYVTTLVLLGIVLALAIFFFYPA